MTQNIHCACSMPKKSIWYCIIVNNFLFWLLRGKLFHSGSPNEFTLAISVAHELLKFFAKKKNNKTKQSTMFW